MNVRKLILAMAASLIVVPSVVVAEDTVVYKKWSDGWQVNRGEDTCFASRFYEGSDLFLIAYQPLSDRVVLSITDPDSASLQVGQKVVLHLFFLNGSKLDDGWGSSEFSVTKNSGGSQMSASYKARQMLIDLSKSDVIGFSIDENAERMVGAYNLDGSTRAIQTLKECSFAVAGLNPNDPFVN